MDTPLGRVLIVFAHPSRCSANSELRNRITDHIIGAGGSVIFSDLYRMNFNPAAGASDFLGDVGLNQGSLLRDRQKMALQNNDFVEAIQIEQRKVSGADHVIFQFPMWFFGMPAIMKGWFDRILTKGFAYGNEMEYQAGGMAGKSAGIVMTTAGRAEDYSEDGMHGPMSKLLHPITHAMLPYIGFDTWGPVILYGIDFLERPRLLELIDERAQDVVRCLKSKAGGEGGGRQRS